MKRFLPLALLFLVACESPATLQWVSPTPNTTVGGSVVLGVEANSSPPENMVFSVNGRLIAKSYDLSAVWDTSVLSAGDYTLEAKPFGFRANSPTPTVTAYPAKTRKRRCPTGFAARSTPT